MDYLKTYLAALGGTATALLIAATLGKGLLDQWLKKDFKRFEGKLDALASRDETKFNYLHPERAKAALEIYRMCIELDRAGYRMLSSIPLNAKVPPEWFDEKGKYMQEVFTAQQGHLEQTIRNNSVYFTEELISQMLWYYGNAYMLATGVLKDHPELLITALDKFFDTFKSIESSIKEFLGSDAV